MQKMPGLSPASQNGGPGTNVSWRRSSERLQLRMNVSRLRMNVSWRRSMPNVSRPGLEPLEPGTPSPLSFHVPGLLLFLWTRVYLLFAYLTCSLVVVYTNYRYTECSLCWQYWKRHHPQRDEDLAERSILARLVPSVPRASYPKKQCHKS